MEILQNRESARNLQPKKKKKGKDKKSGIGSQEPRKKGTHALSIGSHFRFGILQWHPVAHFSYQHNIQQNLQIVMVGT